MEDKKKWRAISCYLITQEVSKLRVSLHKIFAAMTVAMEHTKDEAKFFILVLWCTCQHVSAKIYLPCSSGGFAVPKN